MILVALLRAMKRKIAPTRQEVFKRRNSGPKRSAGRNVGPMMGEMLDRRVLMSGSIPSLDPSLPPVYHFTTQPHNLL